MTSITPITSTRVIIGVDTHKDLHVAVAINTVGRVVATATAKTTVAGYRSLAAWAESQGPVEAFGIEGTGSYGAELARHLQKVGFHVVEVSRPDRAARRRHGKSDPVDAEAAARAVLSAQATGQPKSRDDYVEMIRVLRVARSTAMKARTQAINSLRSLVVTAPGELRDQLRYRSALELVRTAAHLRPGNNPTTVSATKTALRAIAVRYIALDGEIKTLDAELEELTAEAAPKLVDTFGIGPDTAGALLVAAGDNPERLRSEAAFSMLCGASPVEASSGQTIRHRLNRGGDRQANAALYRVVLVRMRHHAPTRAYVERRTEEGKSKAEIIRCLKRYVAREVYRLLQDTATSQRAAA